MNVICLKLANINFEVTCRSTVVIGRFEHLEDTFT